MANTSSEILVQQVCIRKTRIEIASTCRMPYTSIGLACTKSSNRKLVSVFCLCAHQLGDLSSSGALYAAKRHQSCLGGTVCVSQCTRKSVSR
eukprot:g27039.t1